MAPYTYIGLSLGVAPSGRIYFESFEFIDIDGPAPINDLLLGQALRFGDLDFVADHLGWLQLSKENMAPPHISTPNHGLARASPMIVDSNALACGINAYLEVNPEPELSRCVFYMLVNTFAQLSRSGPLPLEAEFWNPSITLPSEMREPIVLFE
jgi:hypothetical protein